MQCRSCEHKNLSSILHFGEMPLANRLLKKEQLGMAEPKHNLEIVLCEACTLVQLTDIVSPNILFDEYLYFSSNSDTMRQSAQNLVEQITPALSPNAKIIEIASNDGYLLQHYIQKKFDVLGIEPAKNIADYAIARGIPTRCEYFSNQCAENLVKENWQADVIHANNVMAHVPTINDFVAGIKKLLKPSGTAIIEVPYLLNLIEHCEFDTIYHEHVFYFSLASLSPLFNRHQLMLMHVEEIPIHGGSLRLYIKHQGENKPSDELMQLWAKEKALELHKFSYYQLFAERIVKLKKELMSLLNDLKTQGHKIAAYGASAKGSTLLNYFGITKDVIDFVVDRSPIKQGYFMAGNHIPIHAPEQLTKDFIPYTLLLTWNFAEEILQQQQSYRNQGGKFIIPIPHLQVL